MVEQASRRMVGRPVSNDLYMLTFIIFYDGAACSLALGFIGFFV